MSHPEACVLSKCQPKPPSSLLQIQQFRTSDVGIHLEICHWIVMIRLKQTLVSLSQHAPILIALVIKSHANLLPSYLQVGIGSRLVNVCTLIAFLGWIASYLRPFSSHKQDPNQSSIILYTPEQIKTQALQCGRADCQQTTPQGQSCTHFVQMLLFLEDFLAKPHADVGRPGPVCPFVPLSLKKQTILVGMVRTGDPQSFSMDAMEALVRAQRDRFMQMAPTTGPLRLYKAIVIGFPDIADQDAPRLIDQVQQRLKREFTQCGMMIGEFHKQNNTPGLRNEAFRPLRTPFPAIAMRYMVPTDLLFLRHDRAFLQAYLETIPQTPANAKYLADAQAALATFATV